MAVATNPVFVATKQDYKGLAMGRLQNGTGRAEHSLMSEALDHAERARYFAAAAVKDIQRGRHWAADAGMALAATERHLHYEKWDTAEVAYAAQQECWKRA